MIEKRTFGPFSHGLALPFSRADLEVYGIDADLNGSTQTLYLKRKRWSVCGKGCDSVSRRRRRRRYGIGGGEGNLCMRSGEALGKLSSSVYCQLAHTGGIRPRPRRRSRLALSLSEREEISRGIAAEQSLRSIAECLGLGRSPSTVSREIQRNGGYDDYRASVADEQVWNRAPSARSDVSWVAIRGYGEWWRGSSGGIGRPNRLPAG